MFFWGGSWVSGKIIVGTAPAFTIGFFRFLLASIFLLPAAFLFNSHSSSHITRRTVVQYVAMGFIGIFGYGMFFLTGMKFTTAAQGSIIAGINPASVSLWAHIFHKERLDRNWKYAGFVLSFVGVLFVIGVQALIDFQPAYIIGNLLILCAMMTWGAYSTIGKSAMKVSTPLQTTAGSVAFGCTFFATGAFFEGFWTLPAMTDMVFWTNILFLAIPVTFISYIFYFSAIKDIGATRSAVFINLVPVFGVSLSLLLLQETIYWTFAIGLILVMMGIGVINFPVKKNKGITSKSSPVSHSTTET
jgi:drug/metabolite transporter (DMT)-like permease